MIEPIDFTDCERLPGRAYNGANGKKIAVRYDGDVWLLKFPPSTAEKPTTLSYSNSCYSEHVASNIANMIGLRAHETRLGTFTNGKTKVVCACRDFTADGKVLYDFCSIKNTVIDSETGGTGTELDDVLETIDHQSFVDPVVLKAHFWDMFVVDAFLGNFDRHNGNWGFLVDPTTRKAEIAPAFDFGSCLLPQADDDIMRRVIEDKAELDARIYNFPASALKQEGKKIVPDTQNEGRHPCVRHHRRSRRRSGFGARRGRGPEALWRGDDPRKPALRRARDPRGMSGKEAP